jgi:hypothetical protein
MRRIERWSLSMQCDVEPFPRRPLFRITEAVPTLSSGSHKSSSSHMCQWRSIVGYRGSFKEASRKTQKAGAQPCPRFVDFVEMSNHFASSILQLFDSDVNNHGEDFSMGRLLPE